MEQEQKDIDLSKWFSTYGVITAQRILGRFHITIPNDELVEAIKKPQSFYHRILQVPLKNVLNGIVLQQANDYHVYVQKLLIDYLLSGEPGKDAESQGASTRTSIEEERSQLIGLGEDYNQKKLEQDNLIASTQSVLIKITGQWNVALEQCVKSYTTEINQEHPEAKKTSIRNAIIHGLIQYEANTTHKLVDIINEKLNLSLSTRLKEALFEYLSPLITISNEFDSQIKAYLDHSNELSVEARAFRTQFYEVILRVTALINMLQEYKIDPMQDQINREMLYFDKSIGEE